MSINQNTVIQYTLLEASKAHNIPMMQLRDAVNKNLLKHYKRGRRIKTTNIAVIEYLNNLIINQ